MQATVSLRAPAPSDLPTLLALIHALAESDDVPTVATTEAALREHLFGDHPAAFARFIEHADQRAGFVVYSWKWGVFTGTRDLYVQAIYIDPAFRRRGLGRLAMAELARIAVAAGCTRIEWLSARAKQSSADFYDAIGATRADHMIVRRLQGQVLRELSRS